MDTKAKRVALILVILAILGLGLWNLTATRGQPGSGLFSPLFQAYDRIKTHFYPPERIDDQELLYGAIEGIIEGLGDPYSRFLTPEEYERFNSDLEGEFVGVGIRIGIRDGQLIVIAPLEGTPAEKAGVRAGDKILEIDGVSTEGITLDEAVERLRGERGTPVTLKVEHQDGSIEEITIIRDLIQIAPVEYKLETEEIGYLQIKTFSRGTARETKEALSELVSYKVGGVILDLRNNSGGLLDEAIGVASYFVDQGAILTSQDRFNSHSYPSNGNEFNNLPVAVLINEGTASASEIVAGAIHDHQMGILVGRKSFGKGVIQSSFPLSDGSAVVLTTAEYFTPGGHKMDGVGLVPDIYLAEEEDDLPTAVDWLEEHLGTLCPCLPPSDDREQELLSLPFFKH